MNIILALDSAMGIFNNVSPRVNYVELDLQMPCHPEYFELSGYAEMLARSSFPRARMKLIDAFQRLFVPSHDAKAAYPNESLCCWDMLYLIHGSSILSLVGVPTNLLSLVHALLAKLVRQSPQPHDRTLPHGGGPVGSDQDGPLQLEESVGRGPHQPAEGCCGGNGL